MHVVLVIGGEVEVDHAGHALDVDASGSHIGGHQGFDSTVVEVVECTLSLSLAAVAVDCRGTHARGLELAGDPIGAVASA